jgi:uncharacterized phage protein gp47/JayE
MPFQRDSLQTIIDRIVADFQTRITGANSLLRRSVLGVVARVTAGAVHLLYEYLDFQARQIFATTADEAGLDAHANEYGVTRKAATYAIGSGQATGTTGTVIPAGSELSFSDGRIYTIDTEVTIVGEAATVDFTAEEAGTDGNEDGGAVLSFVSPIAGITTAVTVDVDGITGGTDQESDDDLRDRVLTRKRQPPHGGAYFDYETWALEVSGVTRAWSVPQYQGIGTIGVSFVRDNDTNIIPDAVQRAAVRAYIVEHEDPATGLTIGCPVTAEPGLFIIELTALTVNIEVALYPNTSTVQDAVESNLADLILQDGGPGNTLYLSRISEAISLAVGEERHSLTAPVADITAATNQIHVLGTVTFTTY